MDYDIGQIPRVIWYMQIMEEMYGWFFCLQLNFTRQYFNEQIKYQKPSRSLLKKITIENKISFKFKSDLPEPGNFVRIIGLKRLIRP